MKTYLAISLLLLLFALSSQGSEPEPPWPAAVWPGGTPAEVGSLDIVVARAGKPWPRASGARQYDVLKPLLGRVATAVGPARYSRHRGR